MNESKHRRMRDRPGGQATLINDGCKIVGEITGSGDYMINGEVIGDCDIDGTVSIAINGYWNGSINAENVIIAGGVDGDIKAQGKVEITTTAKISGTVTGDAIAVAEGAVVEGAMKTTGRTEPFEFVEKRNG